ncbi:hypothetical protein KM043_000031, partial [Ampulex compressa]
MIPHPTPVIPEPSGNQNTAAHYEDVNSPISTDLEEVDMKLTGEIEDVEMAHSDT